MERPAAAVARAVPITTNRHAATNNSALRVRATLRNSGRNTKRPKATIAATASSAWPTATPNAATLLTWVVGANVPRTSSIGTTARSWNSRIAKLVRPVAVLSRFSSDSTWITTAVEDIEGQTDHPGADPVLPEKDGDTGQHRGAKHHLQGAETKY